MIVVEGLVDGNEHLQAGINGVRVRLLVDDLRGEGSCPWVLDYLRHSLGQIHTKSIGW